jgi:hypothetical protein
MDQGAYHPPGQCHGLRNQWLRKDAGVYTHNRHLSGAYISIAVLLVPLTSHTFVELIAITLNSPSRSAAIKLKIGGVLNKNHISTVGAAFK